MSGVRLNCGKCSALWFLSCNVQYDTTLYIFRILQQTEQICIYNTNINIILNIPINSRLR